MRTAHLVGGLHLLVCGLHPVVCDLRPLVGGLHSLFVACTSPVCGLLFPVCGLHNSLFVGRASPCLWVAHASFVGRTRLGCVAPSCLWVALPCLLVAPLCLWVALPVCGWQFLSVGCTPCVWGTPCVWVVRSIP